jgi:RNA polymerase sigma factor (sigma-70 family)
MDDEKIIALFFARSEQAIDELDCKYGKLCRRLSHNILGDRSDAEECVNDAYLGAWNAIPPASPNPLQAYICKIVRNLSLKRRARREAAKRSSSYEVALSEIEDCLSAPDSVEALVDARELARMMEAFLAAMHTEDRVIFMLRYAYCAPYADIAKRLGLTEKNVSVRLVRIRRRMKRYLAERGIFA